MSTEYIEKSWREITSRNPISQDQFATGLKDFKFSVGSGYGFIPNQSYFTVELKMTYAGDKPIAANSVAFADSLSAICSTTSTSTSAGKLFRHLLLVSVNAKS